MVDSLNSSSCFHLVDFSHECDYFLPSTPLGCICFFKVHSYKKHLMKRSKLRKDKNEIFGLIISCHLLLLGVFVSFCSRAFRCVVKLLMCALSSFFLETLGAMRFPLRNAFIVSHKFGYVVSSFSFNSKNSLISFFIS